MGEAQCGGVRVWGSCRVGDLQCGGVAVWERCNVGELQYGGERRENKGEEKGAIQKFAGPFGVLDPEFLSL